MKYLKWVVLALSVRGGGFTWMARGTRGWTGTNVSIAAYVLDDTGQIVGRSDGCFKQELRPTHSWSCFGMAGPPLAMKEGAYDIVFAMNDRPVAWWPMEAAIRKDHSPGGEMERWLRELKRHQAKAPRVKKPATPPPPPPPPPPPTTKPPAVPPKPAPTKPPAKP